MTNSTVIMLSGWKRSGKSTVAEALVKGWGYKEFSIAGSLKDLVSEKYGIPRDRLDSQAHKEQPLLHMPVPSIGVVRELISSQEFAVVDGKYFWTPRALCIYEGGVARAVDLQFWIKQTMEMAFRYSGGATGVVISDVRFPSEVEYIRSQVPGALLVRIERDKESPSQDATERSLDGYPAGSVIENTGTMSELYAKVRELHYAILGRTDTEGKQS